METKTIFNLHLTYEEALASAQTYQSTHKADNGETFHIWDDPRDFYGQRIVVRTDEFFPTKTFDANIAEMYEVGTIDAEAKAALLWLIERHKGFNPIELGQVIVGIQTPGFGDDKMVAIYTYLSREDDCMRDFISEKAYELTNR